MEFSNEEISPYFHTLVHNAIINLTAEVSDALVCMTEKKPLCCYAGMVNFVFSPRNVAG
jgi:hypothetical protein